MDNNVNEVCDAILERIHKAGRLSDELREEGGNERSVEGLERMVTYLCAVVVALRVDVDNKQSVLEYLADLPRL